MMIEKEPLGVFMMPLETRRDAIMHLATQADAHGYDALFLPEAWSYATPILLTDIATKTKNIHLGTGILGVWGRSAATLAMESATLNEVSNGRFILGLGSSTAQLTEGLHDIPYERPFARMRQTIVQVRALLQGERIPLALADEARPLRLNLPEFRDVPIYLAGSSPPSIRIAGELCDGSLPFLIPRDYISDGKALLREGASRSGDPERRCLVCPVIPTVVAEDTETARKGAAWVVAFYLTTMGPLYRAALSRWGYETEVNAVLEANPDRNPSIVPPEAELMLEQLTIYGTPDEVREKLTLWYKAGADTPALMLNPGLSDDEISFTLRAFRHVSGVGG